MAANKRASKEVEPRRRQEPNRAVPSKRLLATACSERRALMRADAILRCVAVALEYGDWSSDEPDYVEAIEVARNLVSQSIERLESHPESATAGSVRSRRESST
jgi:hypothetical protein